MYLASLQLVDALVQPIGFLWCLMVLAGALLLWKCRWRMAVIPGSLALLVWMIGGSSLPFTLLAALERPYCGTVLSNVPPADAVVMLGGTHRRSRYDAFGLDLTPCADRVIMAVELTRMGKGKALVLGGNQYWDGPVLRPDSDLLRNWLQAWQVPGAPVFTLGINADTHDEAVHTKALMKEKGWQKIILVTSAFHMKRAEAVFATEGVRAVGVACDFQASTAEVPAEPDNRGWFANLIPRIEGFEALGLYLHEKAGWILYRYRGWIGSDWEEQASKLAARNGPEISGEDHQRK